MPAKDDAYYAALPSDAADWNGPSMYTTEGDDAVRKALAEIKQMASGNLLIRNKNSLTAAATPILKTVAEIHPEIYDTEPRAWIADRLDEICKANGWAYEQYEGYDW